MLYLFMVDIETGSTTTSSYCLGSWYTQIDTWNIVMLYLFMVEIETGSTTTSPYCLGSWYTYMMLYFFMVEIETGSTTTSPYRDVMIYLQQIHGI